MLRWSNFLLQRRPGLGVYLDMLLIDYLSISALSPHLKDYNIREELCVIYALTGLLFGVFPFGVHYAK